MLCIKSFWRHKIGDGVDYDDMPNGDASVEIAIVAAMTHETPRLTI